MSNLDKKESSARVVNSGFILRVTFLLLLVVASAAALCFLALLIRDRLLPSPPRKASDNPEPEIQALNAFVKKSGDAVDNGIPKGATPAARVPLHGDTGNSDDDFQRKLDELRKSGREKEAKLLAERDAFAARRLKLLHSLENAKNSLENQALKRHKKSGHANQN